MPELTAVTAMIATLVIVKLSFREDSYSAHRAAGAVAAGGGAFLAAFIAQMTFFFAEIQSQVVDVAIEEICKAAAIITVLRFASPIAVTASFACFELIFGKLLFMFWINSTPYNASRVDEVNLFLMMASAILMHLGTGLSYSTLGVTRGIGAAIALHIGFNMLARHVESQFTLAWSTGLFVISGLIVVLFIVYDEILTNVRRRA